MRQGQNINTYSKCLKRMLMLLKKKTYIYTNTYKNLLVLVCAPRQTLNTMLIDAFPSRLFSLLLSQLQQQQLLIIERVDMRSLLMENLLIGLIIYDSYIQYIYIYIAV